MFFWYRHYKALFFVGFLIVLCAGGYVWYENLYQYRWSDQTKKIYLDTHFKETLFKENVFSEAVSNLEERTKRHGERPQLSRNLFSGETIQE